MWSRHRNIYHCKNGKTITLVPLTPKQVYDDQKKLKGEYEAMWRENQGEEQEERRPSKLARTQNIIKILSVILLLPRKAFCMGLMISANA
jgi:hypothetical protein